MHELSIATSLIEVACESAELDGANKVTKLSLRIGDLSGVVADALHFSFSLAAEGTLCEGAELDIEHVPVVAHCPRCDESFTLRDVNRFICPKCESPTPRILTGQELDLISLEVHVDETARA